MNYTELETAIRDYCQNDETSFVSHINEFIISAEDKAFSAINGPMFWKTDTSVSTVAGTNTLELAEGTIDILSVRISETAGGAVGTTAPSRYLLRKEREFLLEAFPGTAAGGIEQGIPKYYAVTNSETSNLEPVVNIVVGPTPDAVYNLEVQFYGKLSTDSITYGNTPMSAVASTDTTWLSATFPDVLLWGSVVHGYTYMKGDPDMLALYQKNFDESLILLKNLNESRQGSDTYSDQDNPAPGAN
jgi:hypothetical protein